MVSKLISDGDKINKKPIELGIESLKSFATSYEQLRNCEKSMVAAGYREEFLDKGHRVYGPLIKMFAMRKDAPDFTRRPSLFDAKNGAAGH